MASSTQAPKMTIAISTPGQYDAETIDRHARELLAEIRELDVESADFAREGEVPEGAKAGDLVAVGTLAVAVLPTVVPKLVDLLQNWTMRAENRVVKIKAQVENRSIEVEYNPSTMSEKDLKNLIHVLTDAVSSS